MRKAIVMAMVALLALTLAAPAASAKAEHTDFQGLYFPAGLAGTGTDCPVPVSRMGRSRLLRDGHGFLDRYCPAARIRVRDMVVYERGVLVP